MSTEESRDPHDLSEADRQLMADARARITARWQAAETIEPPPAKPPSSHLKRRLAIVGAAALLLVAALLAVSLFDTDTPDVAQPSGTGRYVPGVIDPPTVDLTLSSSTTPPSSSSVPPSSSTPPPVKPPAPQPPAPPTYHGQAGPGCGGFTKVGEYRDGREGWVDHGDGRCGTSFVSIPMSGDANRDDPTAHALWTFNTAPITRGSCAVVVFIPNGNLEQVGGNPTSYRVYDGSSTVGAFAIKQVDHRGKWVSVGSFGVTSGKLTVQLLTRGVDWNRNGPTFAHHAASTVKADCRA